MINTICENALIAAYARQISSVTPEIVDNVARDLRLHVVYMPEPERIDGHNEMDIQRATNALLDLYAGSDSGLDTGQPVQVSEHEPYI